MNNYWREFRVTILGHNLEQSTLIGRLTSILVTFISVVFCWVYFRAKTVAGANTIAAAMLNPDTLHLSSELLDALYTLPYLVFLLLVVWALPNTFELANSNSRYHWKANTKWLLMSLFFVLAGSYVMLYGANTVNEFLYFNF